MRGTSSDPAVTDDSSATQWGFRYGRGSPAPKPLGGTGNGYEYDQARGKVRGVWRVVCGRWCVVCMVHGVCTPLTLTPDP